MFGTLEHHGKLLHLAIAYYLQHGFIARVETIDLFLQRSGRLDDGGIDGQKHISFLHAGLVGCSALGNLVNIYAIQRRKFHFLGDFFSNGTH